jgi:dTDP-4-dehydrorhamnose reductase
MSPPRILVTGATGLLGSTLKRRLPGCEVIATARNGGDIRADLRSRDDTSRLIEAASPDAVIHAAALTDVNQCEASPQQAFESNALATQHLATHLPEGCHLIYLSTDQVYPDTAGPHREGSEAPVNSYGRTKLTGEWAARLHGRSCVLRTNFFGPSDHPDRTSISDFMTLAFSEGRPVTLFRDVLFSPLHMATLCDLLLRTLQVRLTGVFNAGSRDGMSKADFGLRIAALLGAKTDNAVIGESTALRGRAPRPRDLRMDVGRLEAALGIVMPTFDHEINKLAG